MLRVAGAHPVLAHARSAVSAGGGARAAVSAGVLAFMGLAAPRVRPRDTRGAQACSGHRPRAQSVCRRGNDRPRVCPHRGSHACGPPGPNALLPSSTSLHARQTTPVPSFACSRISGSAELSAGCPPQATLHCYLCLPRLPRYYYPYYYPCYGRVRTAFAARPLHDVRLYYPSAPLTLCTTTSGSSALLLHPLHCYPTMAKLRRARLGEPPQRSRACRETPRRRPHALVSQVSPTAEPSLRSEPAASRGPCSLRGNVAMNDLDSSLCVACGSVPRRTSAPEAFPG